VKYGTPAGEAAKVFAKSLVASSREVRLEEDAEGERSLDAYGRRLAHAVLVLAEGERLLAEEVIRAGHSPHFVKYGRSLRFDARFEAAETEARQARRGIWGEAGPAHYPDYEERRTWWRARAEQVDRWRAAPASAERVRLGVPEGSERLAARVGLEVVVFGEVRDRRDGPTAPWILWLQDRPGRDFPVVFFDEAVFRSLDPRALASRYLTVRGRVTLYRGRPQVVVERAAQVDLE
jgi:hypothetical protein